ncbi:hypothetical protein VE03_05914 [Pseudogymnoascus sp. 23342-1-I1]|nr:hypothetical protein VE03_05914 [Pseudogymnoascus sp. 23342-1-I1]
MKLALLSWQFLATSITEAYLVSPAGTAAPGTTEDCTQWVEYSSGLTCALLETYFGMTEAEFEEWNPIVTELGDGCELLPGLYYCVQVSFTTVSVSSVNPITITTSTTSSITVVSATTTTTTTTGSSIATPTPIEPGMVDGCTGFHLVVSGDTCADIAADAGRLCKLESGCGLRLLRPLVGLLCLYRGRFRLILVITYIFHCDYSHNDHCDHDIDIDREWSDNPNSLRVWHHR